MKYDNVIQNLRGELARIDHAIASLEAITEGRQMPRPPRSRRGRKSMGAEERLQVAERMRKYWAGRRKAKGARA